MDRPATPRRLPARALVTLGFVIGLAVLVALSYDGGALAPTARAELPAPSSALFAPSEFPDVPGLITARGAELRNYAATAGTRGVVVNAWATWCGSCKGEIPMLLKLAPGLERDGIQLLFVSVDEPEARAEALAFLRERAAPTPSYWATRPLGPFKQALSPKWPGMLPATFLYDAEGELRYFWGGPVLEHELLEIVKGFLAGEPIDGEAITGVAPGKVDEQE